MSSLYTQEPYQWIPLLWRRIANRLMRPYGINPFPRAFDNTAIMSLKGLGERFDRIYTDNYWGNSDSRSGDGSELSFTKHYRQQLVALLRSRMIQSMLDVPCGDLRWMRYVIDEVDITYIGGDVSGALIEEIKPHHSDIELRQLDLTKDPFPTADVWHCRDCLFHLSFSDLLKVFDNALRSDCRYALLTTHKARLLHRNLDISSGGFRMLDLERPPFNLPPAEAYLHDYAGSEFPRYVGLWPVKALRCAVDGLRRLLD